MATKRNKSTASPQPADHQYDRLSQAGSVKDAYSSSIKRMAFMVLAFCGLAYFTAGGGSGGLLSGSIFNSDDEGADVESVDEIDNDVIKVKGSIKIDKFFPPKQLSFKDWTGKTQTYPFFQRSRNFVPRFRLGTVAEGWKATFNLTSENPDIKPLKKTVKEANASNIVKARFGPLKPGRYKLDIEVADKTGRVMKEISHNEIWILDKSVALIGDDVFAGLGQGTYAEKAFKDNKFGQTTASNPDGKSYGVDAYIEKAYRDNEEIVFPINLAHAGQTPGNFLASWLDDGRRDYVFSIDGQKENESFLAVDEVWIGFFYSVLDKRLTVDDYIAEMVAVVDQLNKRGVMNDQIVLVEPPFSAEFNMKDYVLALRAKADEMNVRVGPPVYELSRNEYGKLVSFENERLLTAEGMDSLGRWLVERDLGLDQEAVEESFEESEEETIGFE